MPFPMGGQAWAYHFPEASGPCAVRVPERLTERCCSFGVHGWRPRNSPAQGRCVCEFTARGRGALPSRAVSADLAVAVLATRRELVLGRRDGFPAVGPLTWEVGDRAGQFAHRAGHGDTEHALAALQ